MPITHERGYLIPAVNSDTVDYVACAEKLASSIRQWHPDANITILTKEMLPHGDLGGYANDWQVFLASPYRQTIKLEADMYCASPVDHWWSLFEHRDVVVSQGARDFYGVTTDCRSYRKIFDVNNLPDVYNAITYWRLSPFAREFFLLTKQIFSQWTEFKSLLKFPDDHPTTDVVYAIAVELLGRENCTLPNGVGPSIVHMKKNIIPLHGYDWTKELIWEYTNPGLRINTIAQSGMVHYHIKDWV